VSLRTDRIAHQLRDEIARVLREDVSDARVRMVTLTRVDVAPDLSNAIVQWSLFDKTGEPDLDKIVEIEEGLDSAAGFVRKRVAKVLELRKMPALRFRYDPSLRWAGETMEVLNEIKNDETKE
jgi:ribosome-binding factor A